MIVDDDDDDREFFCAAIAEIDDNIKCLGAINGEDALHRLKCDLEHKPDFIFLDLNMPRMNGLRCLSEIKGDTNLKDIPVIIYSTTSSQRETEQILQRGATFFINKPTSLTKLREDILQVMEKIGISV